MPCDLILIRLDRWTGVVTFGVCWRYKPTKHWSLYWTTMLNTLCHFASVPAATTASPFCCPPRGVFVPVLVSLLALIFSAALLAPTGTASPGPLARNRVGRSQHRNRLFAGPPNATIATAASATDFARNAPSDASSDPRGEYRQSERDLCSGGHSNGLPSRMGDEKRL
ncbi:unnamed protein product, partial [Protopolystoma xenopodis]